MLKNLMLMVLSVFAAGCGYQAHTYVMEKPRIGYDQVGNGGCVMGKCPAPAEPLEKTRRVYVLELTKPVPESEVQNIESQAISAVTERVPAPSSTPASVEPASESIAPSAAPAGPSNFGEQTYTVVKDDTLQKISKKFYDTYSKWYKIYKANKGKIKNPNFLKPGTVLTIPAK